MGSSKDPYHNEFHLALNKSPGLEPGQRPPTEWLNMGYWKVGRTRLLHSVIFANRSRVFRTRQETDKFPEACEGLRLTTSVNTPSVLLTLSAVFSARFTTSTCSPS